MRLRQDDCSNSERSSLRALHGHRVTALRSIDYSCSGGGGGGGGGGKEHTAVLPPYILSNDHLKVYVVHTISARIMRCNTRRVFRLWTYDSKKETVVQKLSQINVWTKLVLASESANIWQLSHSVTKQQQQQQKHNNNNKISRAPC